jgi:hypothetical protein
MIRSVAGAALVAILRLLWAVTNSGCTAKGPGCGEARRSIRHPEAGEIMLSGMMLCVCLVSSGR